MVTFCLDHALPLRVERAPNQPCDEAIQGALDQAWRLVFDTSVLIGRADSQQQATRRLQIHALPVRVLDQHLLEAFRQSNLERLVEHSDDRCILGCDGHRITALVEGRQQSLHDPKRPRHQRLGHGDVQVPWSRLRQLRLISVVPRNRAILRLATRGASNSRRRTLYQWVRDLQIVRYVDPPLGIVLAKQLGRVSLRGLRIRRVQNDPFEARVLYSRQWTLPHAVAMLLLCPPAARRDGDAVPGADLSESSAGKTDAAGDTDDGLRPDLLIERFTGENDWFIDTRRSYMPPTNLNSRGPREQSGPERRRWRCGSLKHVRSALDWGLARRLTRFLSC